MENRNYYDKMSNTPVEKLIITLSIPTVISMMVTNIYNLVDTSFVGKLGNSANGAVGVVFGFMAILQAVGFMFGQGSGSILSRKLGEKDPEGASIIASTGFLFSFIAGLLIGIISYFNLDWLVMMLGSTETIKPFAKDYITYLLFAAPFVTSSFTLNNILRYEGKAMLGMIGLISGGVLNIAGDYIFMFKLNMGISGAGLSTAISQVISFSLLLLMFLLKKTQCRLLLTNIAIDYKVLNIMMTGLPSMLRQALNSVSTIILNSKAGFYGDEAVAAMSNVGRIMFFVFSIAIGIGQGFQPVSGFSYGAKKYNRLNKAYKFTFFASELLMLLLMIVVYFKCDFFLSRLNSDEKVVEIGIRAARLLCIGQMFMPFCMVTEMTMQSTGRKTSAIILSSLRGGLIFIPCTIVLSYVRGLKGIQEAQPLAYILSVIPAIIVAYLFFKKLPKEENV